MAHYHPEHAEDLHTIEKQYLPWLLGGFQYFAAVGVSRQCQQNYVRRL